RESRGCTEIDVPSRGKRGSIEGSREPSFRSKTRVRSGSVWHRPSRGSASRGEAHLPDSGPGDTRGGRTDPLPERDARESAPHKSRIHPRTEVPTVHPERDRPRAKSECPN